MITLPQLPYDFTALAPIVSEKTLRFHYEKHHAGYVNTVNTLIKGSDLENKSLEQIILTSASDTIYTKLFNNAAQTWNHTFYWHSLTPDAQKHQPSAELLDKISKTFGSLTELQNILIEKGLNQFASGWVWLVAGKGDLRVITTANADTPLVKPDLVPLLCLDVWEHAYYLDYQNLRKDYLEGIVQNLLNWEFADQNWQKNSS
ncbi:MAG: superoxide dismutase [Alphaproteobacteria bacterium]